MNSANKMLIMLPITLSYTMFAMEENDIEMKEIHPQGLSSGITTRLATKDDRSAVIDLIKKTDTTIPKKGSLDAMADEYISSRIRHYGKYTFRDRSLLMLQDGKPCAVMFYTIRHGHKIFCWPDKTAYAGITLLAIPEQVDLSEQKCLITLLKALEEEPLHYKQHYKELKIGYFFPETNVFTMLQKHGLLDTKKPKPSVLQRNVYELFKRYELLRARNLFNDNQHPQPTGASAQ